MVLVAACYEYWIIYGKCATGGIQTTLYEAPYNVGNHIKKNPTSKPSTQSNIECPGGNTEATSNGTGLEWYDTFPYNLISFLNTNKDYNGSKKDTSNTFALSELVKIPARSLLLGFFYCIIFSRIAMKGLIGLVNYVSSNIYNKEPNKYSQFMSGLIFIVVFMGIYGSLADRFITPKLPFLNASSLFLLALIIILTVWIPSLLSFFMMMLSYIGYRRGSYTKYKDKRKKETDGGETDGNETEKPGLMEQFYQRFDFYLLIEYFFMLKMNFTINPEDSALCKNETNSDETNSDETKGIFEINKEEDLDWFFPIRRSKMEWSCWSPTITERFKNLFRFDLFFICKDDETETSVNFGRKYYWYLSEFWYHPEKLFWPMFTLNVSCDDVNDANAKSSNWREAFWFYLILTLFIPQIRFYMFLISLVFLIVLMVLILLSSILWTCIVITIVIYSIFIALLGNILALFYLHFYVIIGFFYVPFKKYPELLKIIKSHGNILTLLFCMIVVLAGVKVLHPTSVGVIGGILGLLVVYKLITLLSV